MDGPARAEVPTINLPSVLFGGLDFTLEAKPAQNSGDANPRLRDISRKTRNIGAERAEHSCSVFEIRYPRLKHEASFRSQSSSRDIHSRMQELVKNFSSFRCCGAGSREKKKTREKRRNPEMAARGMLHHERSSQRTRLSKNG